MHGDYSTGTFSELKDGELCIYGEYCMRRLMLEAWDQFTMTTSAEMAKC